MEGLWAAPAVPEELCVAGCEDGSGPRPAPLREALPPQQESPACAAERGSAFEHLKTGLRGHSSVSEQKVQICEGGERTAVHYFSKQGQNRLNYENFRLRTGSANTETSCITRTLTLGYLYCDYFYFFFPTTSACCCADMIVRVAYSLGI